jgi:hypothetical protein
MARGADERPCAEMSRRKDYPKNRSFSVGALNCGDSERVAGKSGAQLRDHHGGGGACCVFEVVKNQRDRPG